MNTTPRGTPKRKAAAVKLEASPEKKIKTRSPSKQAQASNTAQNLVFAQEQTKRGDFPQGIVKSKPVSNAHTSPSARARKGMSPRSPGPGSLNKSITNKSATSSSASAARPLSYPRTTDSRRPGYPFFDFLFEEDWTVDHYCMIAYYLAGLVVSFYFMSIAANLMAVKILPYAMPMIPGAKSASAKDPSSTLPKAPTPTPTASNTGFFSSFSKSPPPPPPPKQPQINPSFGFFYGTGTQAGKAAEAPKEQKASFWANMFWSKK